MNITSAPRRIARVHMCDMCETMIPNRIDFCADCAQEVGFDTYPGAR